MRTNIDIDEQLMKKAKKALGTKNKKETVQAALQLSIRLSNQAEIKKLFGKVKWEGNLDEMREGRWF